GNDDNDLVSGQAGFDALFGDAGADELFGGEGNDDLYGGVGNDTLIGGADVDRLWGEDGADVFKFHTKDAYIGNMYYDRVEDFEVGIDKVDLSEFDVALTIPETPLGKPGEVTFEHRFDNDEWLTVILIDSFGLGTPADVIEVRYASGGLLSASDLFV
ncbi:MAG: M10 family metallopeptidase C-terminal domain-containing protein, partial [Microvirga sp.]